MTVATDVDVAAQVRRLLSAVADLEDRVAILEQQMAEERRDREQDFRLLRQRIDQVELRCIRWR